MLDRSDRDQDEVCDQVAEHVASKKECDQQNATADHNPSVVENSASPGETRAVLTDGGGRVGVLVRRGGFCRGLTEQVGE